MICPNCGSKEIAHDTKQEIEIIDGPLTLTSPVFNCDKCQTTFDARGDIIYLGEEVILG